MELCMEERKCSFEPLCFQLEYARSVSLILIKTKAKFIAALLFSPEYDLRAPYHNMLPLAPCPFLPPSLPGSSDCIIFASAWIFCGSV